MNWDFKAPRNMVNSLNTIASNILQNLGSIIFP